MADSPVTSSEVSGFMETIRQNPNERTNWLVFADWFADRSSPAEEYFLAVGCGSVGVSIPDPLKCDPYAS